MYIIWIYVNRMTTCSSIAYAASSGLLQFDLWGAEPKSGRWKWPELKAKIAEKGLRTEMAM